MLFSDIWIQDGWILPDGNQETDGIYDYKVIYLDTHIHSIRIVIDFFYLLALGKTEMIEK